MRNIIVLALTAILSVAVNVSPVSAHHIKTPEEVCANNSRPDCLTTKRILYAYCHKPERVNEEECVKLRAIDFGSDVQSSQSENTTPASITETPTPASTVSSTQSERTDSTSKPVSTTGSQPTQTRLDPTPNPSPKAKNGVGTQTVAKGSEDSNQAPLDTSIVQAANTENNPDSAKREAQSFSSVAKISLLFLSILSLCAGLIASRRKSK